jgi:hypothetical protein
MRARKRSPVSPDQTAAASLIARRSFLWRWRSDAGAIVLQLAQAAQFVWANEHHVERAAVLEADKPDRVSERAYHAIEGDPVGQVAAALGAAGCVIPSWVVLVRHLVGGSMGGGLSAAERP